MRRRRGGLRGLLPVALVLLAGSLAAACMGAPGPSGSPGGSAGSPGAGSGIRGSVLLGPTCPVQVAPSPGASDTPDPCVTPYAATLVLRPEDDETKEVARTVAGADGRFEFRVPPGDYVIWPLPGDPFPTAQQVPVTVVAGEFTEVHVNYDSGIR